MLTNIPGIHALTAWRRYNDGAVGGAADQGARPALGRQDRRRRRPRAQCPPVESRRRGLHTLRQHLLSGSWRLAQPKLLRLWLLRLPAKLTTYGRKLPAIASRRTQPPPLPCCLAGTEPRQPAPGARLSPAAASHVMGVARALATLAPVSPAASRPAGAPLLSVSFQCSRDPHSSIPPALASPCHPLETESAQNPQNQIRKRPSSAPAD